MILCRYLIIKTIKKKKNLESYILGVAGRAWRGVLHVQNRVISISELSVRLYPTQGIETNSIFKHWPRFYPYPWEAASCLSVAELPRRAGGARVDFAAPVPRGWGSAKAAPAVGAPPGTGAAAPAHAQLLQPRPLPLKQARVAVSFLLPPAFGSHLLILPVLGASPGRGTRRRWGPSCLFLPCFSEQLGWTRS